MKETIIDYLVDFLQAVLGIILRICLTVVVLFFLYILHIQWVSRPQEYAFYRPVDTIESIEIIYVDDPLDIQYGRFDRVTGLAVIEPAEWEAFLEQFDAVSFHKAPGESQHVVAGHCVRITYSDGSIEIICWEGTYQQTPPESAVFPHCYFDQGEFYTMIRWGLGMDREEGDG